MTQIKPTPVGIRDPRPSAPSAVKKSAVVPSNYAATLEDGRSSAEILILPDGRILAHNITPAVAAILAELNPDDEAMRLRAAAVPLSTPTSPPVIRSALLPRP